VLCSAHLLENLDGVEGKGLLALIGLDAANKVGLGRSDHVHQRFQRCLPPADKHKQTHVRTYTHPHASGMAVVADESARTLNCAPRVTLLLPMGAPGPPSPAAAAAPPLPRRMVTYSGDVDANNTSICSSVVPLPPYVCARP
jgi:hypothetical protein